ncbi:MAG: hypothetical protein O7G83_02180 [Proteobacteria bacterium]|nr:hypothetical protein [Pseudomonadota bacterium]
MTHNLTSEEFKMLAKAERQMDAGEVPFVVWAGHRMLVQRLVMEELGLETGQTISDALSRAITEAHIASLKATVALDGAK